MLVEATDDVEDGMRSSEITKGVCHVLELTTVVGDGEVALDSFERRCRGRGRAVRDWQGIGVPGQARWHVRCARTISLRLLEMLP